MLSKFYDLVCPREKADDKLVCDFSMLIMNNEQIKDVKAIRPGGTLGLFYEGTLDHNKVFIKTHQPNIEAKKNINKEINIMQSLYSEHMDVRRFCFETYYGEQVFMVMPYLDRNNCDCGIEDIIRIISEYSSRMLGKENVVGVNYTVKDFLNAAILANDEVFKFGLINLETYNYIASACKRYEDYVEDRICICHGDLSNPNIFSYKGDFKALDWEDAMLNVPQYDLLYWLTFFSQRKYYNSMLFDDIKIDSTFGKDIMVMVLAVKSYLSVKNGRYMNFALTIQERINELISI